MENHVIYLVLFSAFLFYFLVIRPYLLRRKADEFHDLAQKLFADMEKTINENKLLKSDAVPSEEDVIKYYKMYVKKFELDTKNPDHWSAEDDVPLTLDEWKAALKKHIESGGRGYAYLIANTSDLMIGFPPNCIYQRMIDYEELVLQEEKWLKKEMEIDNE